MLVIGGRWGALDEMREGGKKKKKEMFKDENHR